MAPREDTSGSSRSAQGSRRRALGPPAWLILAVGTVFSALAAELLRRSSPTVSPDEVVWAVFVGGLVLSGLAAALAEVRTQQRAEVQRLQEQREELHSALEASRRMEAELSASEQRFRSVLTSSPDVIIWMDPDGTKVRVLNREEFFGHDPASIEDARRFTALIHEEDWPRAEEGFSALRWSDPGTITQFEFRLLDAEGAWRWVRARGVVAQLDDGEPYIVTVLTEITQYKREESRRAELEARLVQSQRLEAVGQLAGGVAHDFSNILADIAAGARLALDGLAPGQTRTDIEEIQRTAQRGADLSRQLLLFARGEAGTSPEVLDVNEVVEGLKGMLVRSLGEGMELRTELEDSLEPVYADRNQIERVVMNLVINARDAMGEEGSIAIRTSNVHADEDYVGVRVGLEPGAYVMLEVLDSGEGMDPEVQRRAFEPFFSTKPPGKGTGLGLATVYGIVQRTRGHIEIESSVGEGTSIRVLLPVTRVGIQM